MSTARVTKSWHANIPNGATGTVTKETKEGLEIEFHQEWDSVQAYGKKTKETRTVFFTHQEAEVV